MIDIKEDKNFEGFENELDVNLSYAEWRNKQEEELNNQYILLGDMKLNAYTYKYDQSDRDECERDIDKLEYVLKNITEKMYTEMQNEKRIKETLSEEKTDAKCRKNDDKNKETLGGEKVGIRRGEKDVFDPERKIMAIDDDGNVVPPDDVKNRY